MSLEAVWAGILRLYSRRPATGTAGAELIWLALEAQALLEFGEAGRAQEKIGRARRLLLELGEAG